MNGKKLSTAIIIAGIVLVSAYGCAGTEKLNSRITALEDRVARMEKSGNAAIQADTSKADEAANRAEAAAKKAEEAATRSEAAEKAAMSATQKAETAEKKAAKEFELMQKK